MATEVSMWGTAPIPGVANFNDNGAAIEVGNVFYMSEQQPVPYVCAGAKVWFTSALLASLSAAGVTEVTVNLRRYADPANPALRSETIDVPSAEGWVSTYWDVPYQYKYNRGLALSIVCGGGPGANEIYWVQPSPGPGIISATEPGSPVKLTAAGVSGIEWQSRSFYREAAGVTMYPNDGYLYGVDPIFRDNTAPDDIDYPEDLKVEGWFRTPENTGLAGVGVDPETDLTPWDGDYVVEGYQYRRDFNVTGSDILQLADGAVLHECRVVTVSDPGIRMSGVSELVSCDLEVLSPSNIQRVGINGSWYYGATNVTVRNVRMTGGTIQFWADCAALIEDFYAYEQLPETGGNQHRDGITRRDGSNLQTVRRSRFDCGEDATTGALFIQDTFNNGIVGAMDISECLFEGSGYVLTLEDAPNSDVNFSDIRLNPYGPYSFGPITRTENFTWGTWSEVYYYDALDPERKGDPINILDFGDGSPEVPPEETNPYGVFYSGDGSAWQRIGGGSVIGGGENPGSGSAPSTQNFSFSLVGPATVRATGLRFYVEDDCSVRSIRVSAAVPPTGSDLIVNLKINGESPFPTLGDQPRLPAGQYTMLMSGDLGLTMAAEDYLTLDVDQIGSGTAGSDITVQVVTEPPTPLL